MTRCLTHERGQAPAHVLPRNGSGYLSLSFKAGFGALGATVFPITKYLDEKHDPALVMKGEMP
jgi:hypothetical protein